MATEMKVSINDVPVSLAVTNFYNYQQDDKCAVVITNLISPFSIYQVSNEFNDLNGSPILIKNGPNSERLSLIKSQIGKFKYFIAYSLPLSDYRIEGDLEDMTELIEPGDKLIIPIPMVPNYQNMYEIPDRFIYGLINVLSSEDTKMKQVSEIILTLSDATNHYQQSLAILSHLLEIINTHQYQVCTKQPECVVCQTMKRTQLLDCGHWILCHYCFIDLLRRQGHCPVCFKPINESYPCCVVIDQTDQPCPVASATCQANKSQQIFLPCGHYNVVCLNCQVPKQCPVCNQEIWYCCKLFN